MNKIHSHTIPLKNTKKEHESISIIHILLFIKQYQNG